MKCVYQPRGRKFIFIEINIEYTKDFLPLTIYRHRPVTPAAFCVGWLGRV
jgi:hypothetical protein